jgi:RNA polymerase sigma-70 factor (ECF subfamily)
MEEKVLKGEVVEGEPPDGSTMPSGSGDPGSAARARIGQLPATSGAAEGGTLLAKAIACAKAGDVSALHFLYVRYADDVQGYVRSIVRDRHEAEDITQDVFARLITALDHLRRRRPLPVAEVRTSDEGHEQLGYERSEALRAALEGLPEDQREVLVLRHLAGLSPPEIALRLGKSEAAVHGLHHRGRAGLRAALSELGAAPVSAPQGDTRPSAGR